MKQFFLIFGFIGIVLMYTGCTNAMETSADPALAPLLGEWRTESITSTLKNGVKVTGYGLLQFSANKNKVYRTIETVTTKSSNESKYPTGHAVSKATSFSNYTVSENSNSLTFTLSNQFDTETHVIINGNELSEKKSFFGVLSSLKKH